MPVTDAGGCNTGDRGAQLGCLRLPPYSINLLPTLRHIPSASPVPKLIVMKGVENYKPVFGYGSLGKGEERKNFSRGGG